MVRTKRVLAKRLEVCLSLREGADGEDDDYEDDGGTMGLLASIDIESVDIDFIYFQGERSPSVGDDTVEDYRNGGKEETTRDGCGVIVSSSEG